VAGFSPALPIHRNSEDGYALNKTMLDVIKQNFKNLVLTNPGERIMIPDFGVGIKRFLFEQNTTETYNSIRGAINQQTSKYMPFITINDIFFSTDQDDTLHSLAISINYEIVPLEYSDVLSLNV